MNKYEQAGFREVGEGGPRALQLCTQGRGKTGKTDFSLGMPGPLVHLNIGDRQDTEEIARKRYPGKEILLKDHRFLLKMEVTPQFSGGEAEVKKKKKAFKAEIAEANKEMAMDVWDDVQKSLDFVRKETEIRSLSIDTGSSLWKLIQYAEFGKVSEVSPQLRQGVNILWSGMFEVLGSRDLNLIVAHRVKEIWARRPGSSSDQAYPTGRFEISGQKEMEYILQMNLEHTHDAEDGQFGVKIKNASVGSTELWGEQLWEQDFASLAMTIYPPDEVDPSIWM